MFSAKDLELKRIDHLGIVAGIVDSIGIVEIINNLLSSEPGEKVSAGQVVKAMILNGLSMMSQPLYMFPKFFELIACEHLIGTGVKPEYLNDDKLGRILDKLFIKGLDYAQKKITYGDIEQRWLVVQSQDRKKSDLEELSKKIEKALINTQAKLKKLAQEKFACVADARKELTKISKGFKYHQVETIETLEKIPNIKEENQSKYYQISAIVSENKDVIDQEILSAGRFIIATNVLSDKELCNEKMLSEYKAQQSCERGFSFLKNPLFLADSIFLKSPERIEALAVIMGLCLLVYTLAQREIRAALKSLNYTVKNQLGKAINNPTMRWIFQCFQSVHLVNFQQKTEFCNLTSEMKYILLFLPEACRNYYKCIS
jgi:transposase